MRSLSILTLSLLVACGSPKPPAPTPVTEAPVATAPPVSNADAAAPAADAAAPAADAAAPAADAVATPADAAKDVAGEPTAPPLKLTAAKAHGGEREAPAVVEGVPPLELLIEDSDEAYRANVRGLAALKANDDKAAAAAFIEALNKHHYYTIARYNLACAFARAGDARALKLLQQLVASGLQHSLEIVAKAPADKDFAKLAKDPELSRLSEQAKALLASGAMPIMDGVALDPSGTRVTWHVTSVGSGVTLTWAEPAEVRALRVKSPACAQKLRAVLPGTEQTIDIGAEDWFVAPLSPSSVATSMTLVLADDGSDQECGAADVQVEVLGVQPPPADAKTPVMDKEPRPAEPVAITFDAGEGAKWSGLPAVSDDGRYVVMAGPLTDSEDGFTIAVIIDTTSEAEILRVQLSGVDKDGNQIEPDDPRIKRAVAQINAKLAKLSKAWHTMHEVGGGDGNSGGDVTVSETGVWADYDGEMLTVASTDGSLFVRNRHKWDHPEPPAAAVKAPKPPPKEGEEEEFEMEESYSVRWSGAWIDDAKKTIAIEIWHKLGVCPGGGNIEYRAARLP